jgi:Mn-dependent DtxR family transcriptional regulator
VRRETTSVSQEDYLKAIWEMLEEEEIPISARVAEQLGVTPPAVTAALKRMTRDDYLRMDRKGHIRLTAKGRGIAQHLALRHQLAEKLLTEIIGLDWAKAHDEAERLEHSISPEVEALLLARFGADGTCPHPKFLLFLAGLKLKPGVHLRVTRREYDQTMLLVVNGKKIHLGAPATSRIWVRRLHA